ncbi:DUF4236 domain-containing protein [Streptomyces sp. NPDC005303]|uniref:DUF4236 domain-containing protein n=1 Tax=Streptomyces sp. NPDC005303 TaxID=3155713 RepID=UPI0033BE9CB4
MTAVDRLSSFKIAPGVRIRLGSKPSSLSVGGWAGRVTLNSRGRRTTTSRLAPGVSTPPRRGPVRSRVALKSARSATDAVADVGGLRSVDHLDDLQLDL